MEWIVQGKYGTRWEDLTAHASRKEAYAECRVYDANETGYTHRVIARRIKKVGV